MGFYRFAQIVVRFVLSFRYKIIVKNGDILPKDTKKGFILAANHTTYGDPLFIGLGFKRRVCFMAKEELFRNPILNVIISALGAFPVSRGSGDQTAITTAIKVVEDGGVLGIFPEGTRTKDGTLGRAKSGAVLVAAKTGGDIYPVGIYYGQKLILRKKLIITYGNPISNESLNLKHDNFAKADLKQASTLVMTGIADALEKGKSSKENNK